MSRRSRQGYGLMHGYGWAKKVVTGAQIVFESSDFTELTVPKFESALAQRNGGLLGLLPPAGSCAGYYQTTAGNADIVEMPPITLKPTLNVWVDGAGPMKVTATQAVNDGMDQLARAIPSQRG